MHSILKFLPKRQRCYWVELMWWDPGRGGWGFVDCLFLPPIPQFAEKFQEVKEAARLAREKSQDGGELTSPALGLTAHQVSTPCPMRARSSTDIGGGLGAVPVPRTKCSQMM